MCENIGIYIQSLAYRKFVFNRFSDWPVYKLSIMKMVLPQKKKGGKSMEDGNFLTRLFEREKKMFGHKLKGPPSTESYIDLDKLASR